MPSRTARAAAPAPATQALAAEPATRSNSHPAGPSPSHGPDGTTGKLQPAAATPRDRSATRSDLPPGVRPRHQQPRVPEHRRIAVTRQPRTVDTGGMTDRYIALASATRHANRWLDTLATRPVPPRASVAEVTAALGTELPDGPT